MEFIHKTEAEISELITLYYAFVLPPDAFRSFRLNSNLTAKCENSRRPIYRLVTKIVISLLTLAIF